jgi:hypothetical protein
MFNKDNNKSKKKKMKRKITFLMAAFLLLCGFGWAQSSSSEVTDELNNELIGVTGTSYSDWTGITSESDAVYAGNSAGGNTSIQLRSNNSNSGIVTTASGGTATKVTVTWNTNTAAGRTLNVYGKSSAYSAATDLYNSSNQGTLIGTIVNGTSTELTINGSYPFIGMRSNSGAMYLDKIEIVWEDGTSTDAPSITASNMEIAYDATSGSIEYEIANPVTGGQMTASTDSEWLTLGTVGETVPFTCTANEAATERTATVTLTYNYNNENISKSVTVTQAGNPNITNTISEITAAGNYIVEGTIVAKSTRGFIVGDGTGYVYYYNTSYNQSDYAIGDMIKLDGPVVIYGGVFEFNNTTEVTAAESSNYTTEEPTVITGQDMDTRVASTTPAQLSNYVQYEGTLSVSGTHYNITNIEGATTAIGSISYPIDTEFTSLQNKKVIVTGYFVGISSSQYYNTMIGSIEEVITTEPTINVTNNNIELAYDATSGEIAYTIDNPVTGTSLTATTDAEWISNIVVGASSITFDVTENDGNADRSATITLSYTGAQDVVVTVNQDHYVADYATLPFAFDGGLNAIAETAGLTQNGLGSDYTGSPRLKFDGTGDWVILKFNERPGKLTFDIKNNGFSGGTFTVQTSEDGITYTDLESYTTITGTQSEEFNNLSENVRYIKWIYTQKVSGNVGLGNIVLEAYDAPVLEPSLTITPDILNVDYDWHMTEQLSISYNDLVIENYQSFTVQFCDTEGQEIEQPAEEDMWLIIGVIQPDPDQNDYLVNCFVSFNEGEARTRCFKLFAYDANNNKVYSNLVTVNQGAFVAPLSGDKYVKVTSTADLTDGQYLIVYEEGSVAFDGGLETLDAVGNTIAVEVTENNEIAVTDETTAAEFTIDMTAGSIKSASGYYIGQTENANGLATSEDEPIINTISIEDDENASIVSANTHLRYNSASNQTRFRYFKSSSYTNQKAIQLYKKFEAATETHTLEIVGYDDNDGGYYLIASPVTVDPTTAVDPDTQEHMILTGEDAVNYDLYYFDEAQTEEWRNYKQAAFNLEPGKGYLYAHKRGGNFTLTGIPYVGDGTIRLNKKGNGTFAGWNLVGNPFNTFATIDRNEFYVMRSDGGEIITSETNRIEAMQGIFVIAENDQETVTFTGYAPLDEGAKIVINVMKNRNTVVDRAIVNLNNHGRLPKFMLNPDNTKVYIPQDNIEYAVAKSEDVQGEMPINFHAAENGTYTFSVNAKNTEMDYLHLIDNKTGEEIDLKANPNYSFDANVSDIEARFTLIFNANTGVNENDINTFAYFNGSEWIINNTDNATVEVVDMLGRVVLSQNAAKHISTSTMASGVYTLRLTNGNEVKTQKIVVK